MSLDRKMVTHTVVAQPRPTGPSKGAGRGSLREKSQEATAPKQPPASSAMEKRNHSAFWGPESLIDPGMPGKGLRQIFTKSLIFYNDTWLKIRFYLKSVKEIS